MNIAEAAQLCRLVAALCPSQRFDQYSPEAWALTMHHIDYRDAKQACADLAALDLEPGKARYIEPGHIIAQVRRIRRKRLDDYGPIEPPSDLTGAEYLAWLRGARADIAAGVAPPRHELPDNPEGVARMAQIAASTARSVA